MTVDPAKFVRAMVTLVSLFFVIGLVMGACSLGMKVPVALFDWMTGI